MGAAISCGELANVLGGTLHLADMPPLGGRCEPVRQMRSDGEAWNPGDVVWLVGGQGEEADALAAQLAFAGGALGVVSERRVTAWPGGFTIQTPSLENAARGLRRWALDNYRGVQITCCRPLAQADAGRLLLRILSSQFNLADWSDRESEVRHHLRAWNEMSRATCLWRHEEKNLLAGAFSSESLLSENVIATITRPVIGAYENNDAWRVLAPQGDEDRCSITCRDASGAQRTFTVRREIGHHRVAAEDNELRWSSGRLMDVALTFAILRLVGCLPETIVYRLQKEWRTADRLAA